MRQAITTKFIGPTDHRGARIKAACEASTVVVPWDHSLGVDGNHIKAAATLARKLGWNGTWYGGAPKGDGYAFVLADAPAFIVAEG